MFPGFPEYLPPQDSQGGHTSLTYLWFYGVHVSKLTFASSVNKRIYLWLNSEGVILISAIHDFNLRFFMISKIIRGLYIVNSISC